MPYFRKEGWLFIHIPKTGGSSLERYFSNKFDVPLNEDSLVNYSSGQTSTPPQHLSCLHLLQNKEKYKISPFLKIISIVRNPYERMMSYLFFDRQIQLQSSQIEVFRKIQLRRLLPQHTFLTDVNEDMIPTIHIMHTETLTQDMHKIGFTDFNLKINANPECLNYFTYLSADSIQLINEIYAKDFKLFGYVKI